MSEYPPALVEKIRALPQEPGVYIFYDSVGRIIYIGKATQLRSRVRSYFSGNDDGRSLFRFIVRRTQDLECIVCANELEALLLENNLIKKHRPRYNVRLRDDKSYLSIRVTTGEKWPRVQLVRGWKEDGHVYFGPFSSAQAVREMLRVIKKFIPLRTCTNGFFRDRTRPCLEHEIDQCTAPCVGLDTPEGYQKHVDETIMFLRGKNQTLLPILRERMEAAAEKREFERAAKIRDQIRAIERVMEKQTVQEVRLGDLDVFGVYRRGDFVSIQVMLSREGKLIHSSTHSFRTKLPDPQVMTSFLTQFYQEDRFLPPEILVSVDFPDRELLERWLSERRKMKVRVAVPVRGDKKKLVEMAIHNAEVNSSTDQLRVESVEALSQSLGQKLGLEHPVQRIECYDISGIQGTHQVASRVVFEHGESEPALYRRYKIRTVIGTDDFASMLEVLERRFRPSKRRDPLPDVVLVDGGKGQITSAQKALDECGVDVPVVGLAKDRLRGGRHTQERVYVPGRSDPLDLPQDSAESLFLQRVRDEAHRFANTYHRELRRKRNLLTGLEEIPGVGEKRRKALIRHFGSLQALKRATQEEILSVAGMTRATAEATFVFLHGAKGPKPESDSPRQEESRTHGPRTEGAGNESQSTEAPRTPSD